MIPLEAKEELSARTNAGPSRRDFVQLLHCLYREENAGCLREHQSVPREFLMLTCGLSDIR
jgi:hypothetical protein